MKPTFKLLLTVIFFLFSIRAQPGTLEIELKPYKEIKDGYHAVCISRYDPTLRYIDQYDTILFSDNGKFSINLPQGRYVLAMAHPSSSIVYYNTYIPDDSTVVHLKVQMDQATVPARIDSVRLTGDFNNWSGPAVKLKYDENKKLWYLPDDATDKHINLYHLLINSDYRTHIVDEPMGSLNTWCNMANVNDRKDNRILFDPAKFKRGAPEPVISGQGADNQYHALCESFSLIKNELTAEWSEVLSTKDRSSYDKSYRLQKEKFDSLKTKYEAQYPWVFPGWEYSLTRYAPVQMKISLAAQDRDNEALRTLQQTPEYIEVIKTKALILKSIEIYDLALTIEMVSGIENFYHYMDGYALYEELDIPYGFFDQLKADILETSKNEDICAYILLYNSHSMHYRPDKAKEILLTINEKYPNSKLVKNGTINRYLKEYLIATGTEAPDFKLVSLSGEEICLSKLKGRYVFIDFWGTWCGPCVSEIPNIKRLHEEIPADKLVIIGICQDEQENVEKFIKEHEITYPNIMADETIISLYGIIKFPTTFLIDKEGVILAKDIRGENLTETIKRRID